jgi:DNA-binding NarL/FixJ family response regulator
MEAAVRQVTRALIVDDHVLFRETVVPVLDAAADIAVVGCVGTLEAARQHLEDDPAIDVLILDHQLPDGAGTHAAVQLHHSLPQLRIVLISGSEDPAIIDEAESAGCVAFVHKADHVDFLVDAVRTAELGDMILSPSLVDRRSTTAPRDRFTSPLTRREIQVLMLLAEGLSNARISEALFIGPNTLRNHVQNVLIKLGAHTRLEAVAVAHREGIISSGVPET